MKTRLRAALLAAAAVGALVFLLETGLRLRERAAGPGGTTPAVLCLGDDLALGAGAYPAFLRAALQDGSGPRREVLVEGDPALDSAALVDRIDSLLLRHRPEVVVASVGPAAPAAGRGMLRALGRLRLAGLWRRPPRPGAVAPASGDGDEDSEGLALAALYRSSGSFDRAETALRQHLVVHPRDAEARAILGETLRELGRRGDSMRNRQAAEEAELAARLDPSLARARRLLRSLRRELGQEPGTETAALEKAASGDLAELLARVEARGARLILIPYPDGSTPRLTEICRSPVCTMLALRGDEAPRVIAQKVKEAIP